MSILFSRSFKDMKEDNFSSFYRLKTLVQSTIENKVPLLVSETVHSDLVRHSVF